MYATARRVLANQTRAQRRRALLAARLGSLADKEAEEDVVALAVGADGPDPLEAQLVRAALARLRPLDQEVLLLSEWEGLKPVQIARVLRCPAVTARGRLFRARGRFRAAYEEAARRQSAPETPPSPGRPGGVRDGVADQQVAEAGAVVSR